MTTTGAVGSTNAAAQIGANSDRQIDPSLKKDKNALGQDAFLKLLIAQLKNQDPMDPVKGADFVAQTAQFSVVEKLEEMSRQNESSLSSQRMLQASTLVGAHVTYTDSKGATRQGQVSSVIISGADPVLKIGTDQVSMGAVSEVSAAAPVKTTPAAGATPTTTNPPAESTSNTDQSTPAA